MENPSLEIQRLVQRTIFDNFTQYDIGYRVNQLIKEYAQSKQLLSQSIDEITFNLQEKWVIESAGGNVLGQKPELNLIDSQVTAYQQRITDVINSSYFSGEQITDIDQLIAMISTDLLDAKTQVGKDQRRLISILYVTNGHPSTAWRKRIDSFLAAGGSLEDLPSLLGNLLIENEVRYQYAKTYYDDLFALYNQHYTPFLQEKAAQYGFNYANLNPLDMVLVNFDELEADKSNYPGFCSVETPIGDSNGDHFALRFSLINFSRVKLEYSSIYANRWEGQNKYRSDESTVYLPFGSNTATDERNELLYTLTHESIHANKLHNQGIYKKIPPSLQNRSATSTLHLFLGLFAEHSPQMPCFHTTSTKTHSLDFRELTAKPQ